MPSNSTKTQKVGHAEISQLVNGLHADITSAGFRPSMMIVVAKGGLIPGAMLAYKLGCGIISIKATNYSPDRQRLQRPDIQWPNGDVLRALKACGRDLLIFDELTDSGATFEEFDKTLPFASTASLFRKRGSFVPTFWGSEVSPEIWLEFPWEINHG